MGNCSNAPTKPPKFRRKEKRVSKEGRGRIVLGQVLKQTRKEVHIMSENVSEKRESNAHIVDGWVVCPYCFKKQFPVESDTDIKNLRYRCRGSRTKSEHFMIVNFESEV